MGSSNVQVRNQTRKEGTSMREILISFDLLFKDEG